MEAQAAQALYEALHKDSPWHNGRFQGWSKERTRSAPYHFRHGVTITVAQEDLNPTDDFLRLNHPDPDSDFPDGPAVPTGHPDGVFLPGESGREE